MGDEEGATLSGQFLEFSKLLDNKQSGTTITLYRSDYWMRQAKIIDDRKVTMTDTGIVFNKYSVVADVAYCDAYFDSFLCWGPTPAGQVAYQNCPSARLSDPTQLAFRVCGEAGLWLGRRNNESSASGWTNYTPCFPTEVKLLFDKVSGDESSQLKFQIARYTRYLEIIGFSVSLLALLVSLFILTYFRSLHNNRTKIHKSLFSAMVVQVIIRLVVYIDQELIRSKLGDQSTADNATIHGIDNMPYLCEVSYVMLEYGITVMFLWMFIEGLYLNNLVTASTLQDNISYFVYFSIGWGLPFIITAIWATVTGLHYEKEEVKKCWYGYNFQPIYWIVQGPRLAVVIINFAFLLNILRVLVGKMRKSENTDIDRARKALRAAFVLLPLLGITNALDMTSAPLRGEVWRFALWSYSTHFLRSFQGFFIALIYCFLNTEVRTVVRKYYENHKAIRETRRRQQSLYRNNGFGTSYSCSQSYTSNGISDEEVRRLILASWRGGERNPTVQTPTQQRASGSRLAKNRSRAVKSRSEATQTGIEMKQLRWPSGHGRHRYAKHRISLPSIHENCRSTSTETEFTIPRRASALETLEIQKEQETTIATVHGCPIKSESTVPCPRQEEEEGPSDIAPKTEINP